MSSEMHPKRARTVSGDSLCDFAPKKNTHLIERLHSVSEFAFILKNWAFNMRKQNGEEQ
jgi:hypothetical protein